MGPPRAYTMPIRDHASLDPPRDRTDLTPTEIILAKSAGGADNQSNERGYYIQAQERGHIAKPTRRGRPGLPSSSGRPSPRPASPRPGGTRYYTGGRSRENDQLR